MTGYFCFQFVTDKDRRLRHAISVLYLFGICCVLALVSALVGGGAVAVLFDRDFDPRRRLLVGDRTRQQPDRSCRRS